MRDELKGQLLLLAANLLSRRGKVDPSHISALYVAAFCLEADSPDSARTRHDEQRELYLIIDKLKAHRLTQAGKRSSAVSNGTACTHTLRGAPVCYIGARCPLQ